MESLQFFGTVISVFSAIIAYQTWQNGRWMKQAHQETQELIKQTHQDTQELIKQTYQQTQQIHHDTQELIKAMHRDMLEMFKKMDESQHETRKEIARLIVSEGEKTRQALKP